MVSTKNKTRLWPLTLHGLLLGRYVYISIILHTTLASAIDRDSYVNFQGKLQCKHTGRRCRTLYRDSDVSEGETLDIRPIPYTETNSEPFCKVFANCRFRSRSLFSSCFPSKSKTILPCLFSLFCLLLLPLVYLSPCNTHTSPRLWSFLSQGSLCFLFGGTWPAAAVACMYILWLFFLSSPMRVFVQTRTHSQTPVGADCCCFVWLQNSHLYLESALHTTSEWRKILSCFFTAPGMTLIEKTRAGLNDKFSPITENNNPSVRPFVCSSRPDVDFVVSRSYFLLLAAAAAVAFPLLCWIISGCCSSTARGPFTFTKNPFTDKRTHTQTLGSSGIVCWLPCHCLTQLTREWHTQSWPGRGRSFFTEDQLALRVNSHFFV